MAGHSSHEVWGRPRVSVIIKALNEEAKIARAIESALAAVAVVDGGGEVILADSLSTDRTVAVASAYPVRIVQLVDPCDRCCGVGAQLGLSAATGAFVYVLDGDMELDTGFLPAAVACLEADPSLAGVAGIVREMHVSNEAFVRRQQSGDTTRAATDPVCLNMGGLYRRSAIESLGYFTNRNLHAFEEFELGARLVQAGWRLRRIDVDAVRHYGHTDSTYRLLLRRWRSRHAWGHGELLRQSWRRLHFGLALARLRAYHVAGFVWASWAALAAVALAVRLPVAQVVTGAFLYWLLVIGVMSIRKRSVSAGLYSVVAWHVGAAGLVRGLLARPRTSPEAAVSHRVLR